MIDHDRTKYTEIRSDECESFRFGVIIREVKMEDCTGLRLYIGRSKTGSYQDSLMESMKRRKKGFQN